MPRVHQLEPRPASLPIPGVGWIALVVVLLAGTVAFGDADTLAGGMFYLSLLLVGLVGAACFSVLLGQPPRVLGLVLFAWLVRVTLMGLLKAYSYSFGLNGFYPFDADALNYHRWATTAAAMGPEWAQAIEGMSTYLYIVAGIYRFAGPDLNLPELLNLSLSLLLVPLVYELASRIGGARAGVLAAILWGILPSGVMWSISLMKDIWVVLGVVLTSFGVLAATRRRPSVVELVAGVLGLAVLAFIRPPYLLIPVLALGVLILLRQAAPAVTLVFVVGAGLAIAGLAANGVAVTQYLIAELVRSTSEEGVEQLGQIAASANTGIPLLIGLSPGVRWIVQFPFSVFAPFPWQWGVMGSGFGRLSALEMMALYVLYFQVWRYRREVWATPEGKVVLVMAFCVFLAVSFSLPNIGSIYRYRWPALALLLCVVPAPGRWGRRSRPEGRPGSEPATAVAA